MSEGKIPYLTCRRPNNFM